MEEYTEGSSRAHTLMQDSTHLGPQTSPRGLFTLGDLLVFFRIRGADTEYRPRCSCLVVSSDVMQPKW